MKGSRRLGRTILRYHGGKFRVSEWIVSHFPAHRVYCEPFMGAASVLMCKAPAPHAEIINDLDSHIVSFFRVLRDPAQCRELERRLRLTPFARAEFDGAYQPTEDPVEAARRLVIKSFMGFGSAGLLNRVQTGFRSKTHNSRHSAAHDWATYPDQLALFCARLQGVTIECRPALDVIRQCDGADTLTYADPPYVHSTRSIQHGSCRYRHEMTDDEHRGLAAVLHGCKGLVAVSGYDCPLYAELYGDWQRFSLITQADGARERTECLWLSPRTAARVQMRLPLE